MARDRSPLVSLDFIEIILGVWVIRIGLPRSLTVSDIWLLAVRVSAVLAISFCAVPIRASDV